MKTKFTKKQNEVLTEIYRRLNYFHSGDLNTNLLYLGLPNEAKQLSDFNLITPFSKEIPRALNWYKLTNKGKVFFTHYIEPLDEKTNNEIFTGAYVKEFDYNLI